jgi:hypothetical protein
MKITIQTFLLLGVLTCQLPLSFLRQTQIANMWSAYGLGLSMGFPFLGDKTKELLLGSMVSAVSFAPTWLPQVFENSFCYQKILRTNK